jgi:transposase-like protein
MVSLRTRWEPPHCPNPACDSHANPGPWRVKKKGFYARQRGPRRVQRYLCQHCHRNFSSQTFATSYWLKRPGLLHALFFRVLACSSYRQIAQEFRISHTSVRHQAERLGRHCLLLHEQLRPRRAPSEPVVLDGFRSFEFGHYWPFDLNLVVGVSHFVYGFNDAELRRSGTLTPAQRHKRAVLEGCHGRPDPRATRQAVQELVGRIVPPGGEAEIHSDEHTAYRPALRGLPARAIRHRTTTSRAARTARNPLFPANLADLLLRHTGANHKRETIAFSKRRQGALYRAAIWLVWRNYLKSTSEKRRDDPPAVRLGIIERRITLGEILRARQFPWRVALRGWLARCYFGRIPTRRIRGCREHRLRYAV